MKTVGLISGGKDSCFNMMNCISEGHIIVALANLKPKDKDELDSYMYQSVGHHAIDLYAEAMGLPLYRREIRGSSKSTGRDYQVTSEDEVEDLYELLKTVKEEMAVEAVSVGAILSNYQRVRVEHVCQRLGLVPLAYLWRRDQSELLDEMITCKLEAILIKVAAMGLHPKKHLGKTLAEMRDYLHEKHDEFDLNVCGEGGEYETFTLDCPIFKKKIIIDEKELVIHSEDAFAPVGYLNLKKAHLEDKNLVANLSQQEIVKDLPLKHSQTLLQELFPDPQELRCVDCEQLRHVKTSDRLSVGRKPKVYRKLLTDPAEGCHFWVTDLVAVQEDNKDIAMAAGDLLGQLQEVIQPQTLSDLVLVHLYVRNMGDFAAVNAVYKTFFGINPAARVCVQAELPENILLMLDCYGNSCHGNKETMHVQGLSHWAPANIGPYSQCVKIDRNLYLAGQIGMVPANLALVDGGIQSQARLSLCHVTSILSAMSPGSTVDDVISCVCYITHPDYIPVAQQELGRLTKDPACELVYVVVPQLPKGAFIEWQVVAAPGIQKPLNVTRSTSVTESVLSCKARGIRCSSDIRWLSVVISVYISDSVETADIDVAMVTKQLRDHKDKIETQGGPLPEQQATMLRIFYPASLFKYDVLRNNFQTLFEDYPVVLVPVTQLENEKAILTLIQIYS